MNSQRDKPFLLSSARSEFEIWTDAVRASYDISVPDTCIPERAQRLGDDLGIFGSRRSSKGISSVAEFDFSVVRLEDLR